MADLPIKTWLDTHVVPMLAPLALTVRSVLWNGTPPTEFLVFAVPKAAATPPDEPDSWTQVAAAAAAAASIPPIEPPPPIADDTWPIAVHSLLTTQAFRFDYLREIQLVQLEEGLVPIFGGDGTPLLGQKGMASVRLWKRFEPQTLILQIGQQYDTALLATAAIKALFARFDGDAVTICQRFAAPFGAA